MFDKLLNVLSAMLGYVFSNFRALFTTTHSSTERHTVLLHTSPLVRYHSPLYVPITVLSHGAGSGRAGKADAGGVKITLVRRGWRAGLFGWTVAPYLGASIKNGIDVTPEHSGRWGEESGGQDAMDATHERDEEEVGREGSDTVALLPTPGLSTKRQTTIDKQVRSTAVRHGLPQHKVDYTCLVRIPASSGDGYFRLVIDQAGQPAAYSPTFRLFSLSLSSACPRGASVLPPTLAPELLLRALSTALYTALLALFPVAAIVEKVLPRSWARWMMTRLYRSLGMEERTQNLMKDWNVQQRLDTAKTQVDQKIPWAGAGIRTRYEIRRDEQRGRGGITYMWP